MCDKILSFFDFPSNHLEIQKPVLAQGCIKIWKTSLAQVVGRLGS